MKLLALICLLGVSAFGQVPDAPSAVCKHGIWGSSVNGAVAYETVPCDSIHQWREMEVKPRTQDGFFAFRTWDQPLLRPNKKSWAIFLGVHAAAWIALTTANRRQEGWGSEAPALAAVTGLDFLAFKLLSPALSIEGGTYAAIHYGRAR